jgi:3-phosphoglycerate kinase
MKKTVRDYELSGKKVLIRCDFNVPIKDNKILDDNRIVQSLQTINYCLDNNAKVILFSHLGRVEEESDKAKNSLSLVATRLEELLNKKVTFISVTEGEELETAVNSMNDKDVILVENTRFQDVPGKRESKNDPSLGAYWASLGDIFINDAFGTIHRAHASNVGIAANIPSGVGFLVEKELTELSVLENPEHPFVVVLGGSKVNDKIAIIENLVKKADKLLIGGGMSYTFQKAMGKKIGKSLLDESSLEFCERMLKEYPDKIVLPVDNVVSKEFSNDAPNRTIKLVDIEDEEEGLDIGQETVTLFSDILSTSKVVFWNGPLGVYELSNYAKGTEAVLKALVNTSAKTILGGGDIVAAASNLGYKDKVTHASTGGGATLEFMEGKELPGAASIMDK